MHPFLKWEQIECIYLSWINYCIHALKSQMNLLMCWGSRTWTAISIHSSAALMMVVDLLHSAIWAPDPCLVREGFPNLLFSRQWSCYIFTRQGLNTLCSIPLMHQSTASFDQTCLFFSLSLSPFLSSMWMLLKSLAHCLLKEKASTNSKTLHAHALQVVPFPVLGGAP